MPNLGPFDWVALGSVATLAAVILALVLAIWGQSIQAWFFSPKLKVSIEMRSPDCIKILVKQSAARADADSYHCRLRITNDGDREAQDVEVRLLKLRKVANGGTGEEDPDFVPLNLTWANTDQITAPRIQPKLDKHCNLCRVVHTEPDPRLEFITEVQPNQLRPGVWPTRKLPGNYLLDIAVAGNNAKVVRKTLRISYTGWFDDDAIMLSKGLVITLVN